MSDLPVPFLLAGGDPSWTGLSPHLAVVRQKNYCHKPRSPRGPTPLWWNPATGRYDGREREARPKPGSKAAIDATLDLLARSDRMTRALRGE